MKIGLEVHVALQSQTKLFCGCPNKVVKEPNTLVCPQCIGMPGSKPRVNAKALESAILIGLALDCKISSPTFFSRKSYFYPDMGKNFQITVTGGEGNMAMKKSDITTDAVRKFVKYVVEDANALVWEWQIEGMEPEFHFYAIVKDGDKTFEVRDVEGEVFTEKAATQMLDAAKSIRLKAPVKAES